MQITLLDVDNRQPQNFKLHRENGRGDYLFVLFKSPARVMVGDQYVDVDRGYCIFFDKYKIQSYHPRPSLEFVHDFMHFDLENDYEKFLFSDIPKGELIPVSLPELISDALRTIQTEFNSNFSEYKADILTHLGTVFLYRIKNELQHNDIHPKKRASFQVLYQLRTQIYNCPQRSWSIEEMCRQTCMSRSYLQHLYKAFFGVSCTEDVIAARIAHAKRLLLTSDFFVQEVAEACGYQNVPHFIRQFRQLTGISPEKFRRQ